MQTIFSISVFKSAAIFVSSHIFIQRSVASSVREMKMFVMRMVKHWNRLLREAVDASPLKGSRPGWVEP